MAFTKLLAASAFLATFVAARPVPQTSSNAATWDTTTYEPYATYHSRYQALDCEDQHGTDFFTTCCGPLGVNESLSSRPADCTPASATSTSATPAVSATDLTSASTSASGVSDAVNLTSGPIVDAVVTDDSGCADDGDDDGTTSANQTTLTEVDVNADGTCPDGYDLVDDDGSSDATSSTETATATSSGPAADATATDNVANDFAANPSGTYLNGSGATATSTHHHHHTSTAAASSSTGTSDPSSSSDSASSSGSSTTSSGDGSTHSGRATFFYQNGVAGACGQVHPDSALIGAMNYQLYGDDSVASPLCGKQVTLTNTDNGKSVTITIADDCPSCSGNGDIDLSTGAFDKIADESTGDVPITWTYA